MVRCTFPRESRLRKSAEFGRIRREGRSFPGRFLLLNFLVNPIADGASGAGVEGATRLGVITSRKVGGAVVRNRIRRYVREVFRRDRPLLRGGWLVVVARKGAGDADFGAIAKDWCALGRRAGIFQELKP